MIQVVAYCLVIVSKASVLGIMINMVTLSTDVRLELSRASKVGR